MLSLILTNICFFHEFPYLCIEKWRDVRVVEGACLENRCAVSRTGGSNPFPSANRNRKRQRATLDCLFLFSICNARRRRAGMWPASRRPNPGGKGIRSSEIPPIPEGKGNIIPTPFIFQLIDYICRKQNLCGLYRYSPPWHNCAQSSS